MQLKIEYLSKKDLKPYANNAKIHTAAQVEQIKKSIQQFDFSDPIAVWGENEIVEGHGRLLAAMEMDEIETVPVIRLDHLTDKQRKAYALAHNKLTMNTGFDLDVLAQEISDIGDELDLTDIGFNAAEIIELTIDDSPAEITANGIVMQGTKNNGETDASASEQSVSEQERKADYSNPNSDGESYGDGFGHGNDVSADDLKMYKERADESALVTRRVIIIYRTDEEERYLKEVLKVEPDKPLGVVYQAGDIIK